MKLLYLLLLTSFSYSYTQNIIPIDNHEIPLGNFANFSMLKTKLADVKIVGLGESTHTAGTTFRGKISMIKYLHDSLNFNLLAFESGIFDCSKIQNDLINNQLSQENFFNGLFSFWRSEELETLYKYILETHTTSNPLHIAGIDNQMLGHASTFLKNDFILFLDSLDKIKTNEKMVLSPAKFLEKIDDIVLYSGTYKKISIIDTSHVSLFLRKVTNFIVTNKIDTSEYFSYWNNICKNILLDCTRRYYPKKDLRDSMMFENVKFHLHNNEKVMLWCASSHLFYNPEYIFDDSFQFTSTGERLRQHFQDQYFFIAFTANGGRCGFKEKGLFSLKLQKSSKNSIEKAIRNVYTDDFGLILMDISENKKFITQKNIDKAKIFWIKETCLNPSMICDAIFYINEMKCPKYNFIND